MGWRAWSVSSKLRAWTSARRRPLSGGSRGSSAAPGGLPDPPVRHPTYLSLARRRDNSVAPQRGVSGPGRTRQWWCRLRVGGARGAGRRLSSAAPWGNGGAQDGWLLADLLPRRGGWLPGRRWAPLHRRHDPGGRGGRQWREARDLRKGLRGLGRVKSTVASGPDVTGLTARC
jgi:hypothetical protein